MRSKKIEWYCYLCGTIVGKKFRLFSMSNSTDRVFILCDKKECFCQIDNEYNLDMKVKKIK